MTWRPSAAGAEVVEVKLDSGFAKAGGVGIPPENLARIFEHGFTTKEEGHGFGLHSSALAAKALGGTLSVASDGWGTGATFSVEIPLTPPIGILASAARA